MTHPVIDEAPPRRPEVGWTELVLGAVAYLPLNIALGMAVFAVTGSLPSTAGFLALGAVATFGAAAIALLPRVRSLAPLRLRHPGARWLAIGLAAGVGVFLVNRLVVIGWMLLTGDTSNPQADLSAGAAARGWSLVGMIAFGGLLVPFAEEALFRGVGFSALRRYGFLVAALGSAAIFALAHGFSVVLVAAFVLGVVNAVLVERSGSLWPAVIAHAVNNTILFALTAVLM